MGVGWSKEQDGWEMRLDREARVRAGWTSSTESRLCINAIKDIKFWGSSLFCFCK